MTHIVSDIVTGVGRARELPKQPKSHFLVPKLLLGYIVLFFFNRTFAYVFFNTGSVRYLGGAVHP